MKNKQTKARNTIKSPKCTNNYMASIKYIKSLVTGPRSNQSRIIKLQTQRTRKKIKSNSDKGTESARTPPSPKLIQSKARISLKDEDSEGLPSLVVDGVDVERTRHYASVASTPAQLVDLRFMQPNGRPLSSPLHILMPLLISPLEILLPLSIIGGPVTILMYTPMEVFLLVLLPPLEILKPLCSVASQ